MQRKLYKLALPKGFPWLYYRIHKISFVDFCICILINNIMSLKCSKIRFGDGCQTLQMYYKPPSYIINVMFKKMENLERHTSKSNNKMLQCWKHNLMVTSNV